MLAWVFRNHARLQQVYGRATVPPLAGERFRRMPTEPRAALPRSAPRPGEVRRGLRGIDLSPMPRRAIGA